MAPSSFRQLAHDTTLYLILLVLVSTLGSLQFGFHIAELNAPQDVISCKKRAIPHHSDPTRLIRHDNPPPENPGLLPKCIPMNDAAFSTVSSAFVVGGLIGALAAGPFASKRGRLSAMRVTALVFLAGSAFETIAPSVALLVIGRLLSGAAAGAATVVVPLYVSEIAPPKERGLFGFMTQISINLGILLTQTLGFFLSHGDSWRIILATGAIIALVQSFGLLFVPESPAWLAANGDVNGARRILQRIRGKDFDIAEEVESWNGEGRSAEQQGLLAQTEPEDADSAPLSVGRTTGRHIGFLEVVKDPLYRPAIIAVVGVMFAQQLIGINSVIMYSVSLLADLLPISSALLTILISVIGLFMTIACAPLPDRLGRKACILASIIGQGSSALILALSIRLGIKFLSAISVAFFVAFFAVGLGPVPFILASELVGQEAVGATQSWCLAANYVATFLVAQFFPLINTALNSALGGAGWVYFIFAGFAALFALFTVWRIPETKGKKDWNEVWGRSQRLD